MEAAHQAQVQPRTRAMCGRQAFRPQALFGKSKEQAVSKQAKRQGSVLDAIDFATPTKKDADILWDAKDNWKKGESKLTPEQAAALARKIRGSYRDYFKEYVEEDRVEATWYKPEEATGTVPFLPLLIGVVVLMLGTTVLVAVHG